MVVVTDWSAISAASAVAVAANVHGKTGARLNDGAVFGEVLDGMSAIDALLSLAGEC